MTKSYNAVSMKKTSSMSKITETLASHVLIIIFVLVWLISKLFFQNYFLEHMGYLWFVRELRKFCFSFWTYQKRFVIRDPESLNLIPRDPFTHKWFQMCPSKRRSYRSNLHYNVKVRLLFDKLGKTKKILFTAFWEKEYT